MRKYRQLLLVIISIVSLSLFLVYRHEYNRLHYVLEVFNFFGQPCNFTDLIESNNVINHHDWGPLPLWNEADGIYVYSSFYLPSSHDVQTLVLRKETANHAKNCYLWYEDHDAPIIGKFKYINLSKDVQSLLQYHHYFCTTSIRDGIPYAVAFARSNKQRMKRHGIASLKAQHLFDSTLCVLPAKHLNKSSIVEFISFHTLIGVDSFLIYADNLPHKFIKLVENLSTRLSTNITFMPWNFPAESNQLANEIVGDECMLRAITQSKYVLSLNVNEYLVPSTHYKLHEVLASLDSVSDRLNLPIQKFCQRGDISRDKPMALQYVDAVRDASSDVKVIYKNRGEDEVISAQGVDEGVLSVHQYIPCDDTPIKTVHDGSMQRFGTDFIRSTLYQLYLKKQL